MHYWLTPLLPINYLTVSLHFSDAFGKGISFIKSNA